MIFLTVHQLCGQDLNIKREKCIFNLLVSYLHSYLPSFGRSVSAEGRSQGDGKVSVASAILLDQPHLQIII